MIFKYLAVAAVTLVLTVQESIAQLSVKLPDREVTVGYTGGTAVFKGAPVYGEPGQPLLPVYKVTFLLPDGIDKNSISVKIENPVDEVVQGTFYVKSALPPTVYGEIDWPAGRNIINGMDMDVYGKNAFFPSDFKGAVTFGKMKQYQLVDVTVNPFRYNPVTRQLKKITGGTLKVTYTQGAAAVKKSLSSTVSDSGAGFGRIEKILKKKVVNPDAIDSYTNQTKNLSSASASVLSTAALSGEGYAIITTAAIVNSSAQLQNLISQKTAQGFNVILATETQWGGNTGDAAAENIRAWLQLNHISSNIQYVLLIGNPDPSTGDVPMKMCWPRLTSSTYRDAPTDFYYAELSGNWDVNADGNFGENGVDYGVSGGPDLYGEVAVGRIPYYGSITDLDKILAKSITYVNETSRGWRKSVLLPMVPLDSSTPLFDLAEQLINSHLSADNWKSFRIYNTINNFSQQDIGEVLALTPPPERAPCNSTHVEDAWKKNPFGLVIWGTHGGPTGASDIFSSSQAPNLNDKYPSMTFQISCLNSYPEYTDNLSYSMLLNGAVSTIGASRVSWYCGRETDYMNSSSNCGMGYTYGVYMTRDGMNTADALNAVKSDVSPGCLWENELVMNLYGCPDLSLNIDNNAPSQCRVFSPSQSRIHIIWKDNSTSETGFRIERALGSGSFTEIATVGADVNSYDNDGLSANTKYRYRVRAYSSGGTTDYSNIDSTSTHGNIAIGKTATASSEQTGYEAAKAIDNHPNSTRWSASDNSMPQWFQVDLGAPLNLSGCEIVFGRAGTSGDCNDFIISTSYDNVTWNESVNCNPSTNISRTQSFTIGGTARYIRINIYDAPGTYSASMYEFKVFGQTIPTEPVWNSAVSAPNNQLQLSWTPSAGAASYTVYQSQMNEPRFVIASGLTTPSFTTTGLIDDKSYIFSVVAFNDAGHSTDLELAIEMQVTVPLAPPAAPANLQISQLHYLTCYKLDWQNNSFKTEGFEIERRVMNSTAWTLIGTTTADVTQYLDMSIIFTETYEYRVRAFNAGGYSDYSFIRNTQIPPLIPINCSAIYDSYAATVSFNWGYASSSHAGFKLERSTDGSNYQLIATLAPNAVSFTNTGVVSNEIYYYRLYAYNNYGISEYAYSTIFTPPDAPSNLTAVLNGFADVSLNWMDNSNSETSFSIEQAVGNGEFTEIGTQYMGPHYYVQSLSPSTTYRFRVRAYNNHSSSGFQASGYSNIVTITTLAPPVPAAPDNLNASAFLAYQINLNWSDNSTNENGFYIERAASLNGPFTLIASVDADVSSYVNSGLTDNTTYWYRVSAYNTNGNSEYSNIVSAATPYGVPPAPSNLVATANSRSKMTVTWTDNSSFESGFYIDRATSSAGPFTQIAIADANVRTYSDIALAANTAYWYRVRAYNNQYTSDYSNTATNSTHRNLSVNGTATAQSQQTGNLAANAKDNSSSTRWAASSGTMSQWWKIDLGSSKTISEAEIMFERTGTAGDCNDFKVETSTDNTNWTTRIDQLVNTNTAQTQGYTFSAAARYVRITISDAPGSYYASMYEFRVFGK